MSGRERVDGRLNRQRVEDLLRMCPGITNVEVGAAMGLSAIAVGRHVNAIRATWLPVYSGLVSSPPSLANEP